MLQPAFYEAPYNIASWPVYSSMLAVLTNIHPAIVFRTILPLFEIPLAYYIAYQLIRIFWKENREKALLALIYFQLFTLLAAEHMPQTSGEWWFVVNCWTGKALMTTVMTPLILWLLIQVEENQKGGASTDAIWRTLLFVCWSGCFISASLFFVVPMELALWGGLYLVRSKRWRDFPKFVLCGLPTLFCALVTTLVWNTVLYFYCQRATETYGVKENKLKSKLLKFHKSHDTLNDVVAFIPMLNLLKL